MLRCRRTAGFAGLGLLLVLALTGLGACAARSPLPGPLEAGWRGEPVCENLQERPDFRLLRCTFPPGVGHERHYHVPHVGYAISGGRVRIVDTTGTREVSLATGSSYASDGVEWHQVLNIGDTTIVYLIVEQK